MTPRQPHRQPSRQPHQQHRPAVVTAVVAAFLALVGGLGLTSAAASSASAMSSASSSSTPYCGIVWGSLAKSGGSGSALLAGVRSGRHECYDRLVVDLRAGASAAYSVEYVDAVLNDPRGDVVPLRGGARLRIVVHAPTATPAHPSELTDVTGYRTFRQVAFAGSFEGLSSIGLGVRARLPFRAFLLTGPGDGSRLVVDVAHQW